MKFSTARGRLKEAGLSFGLWLKIGGELEDVAFGVFEEGEAFVYGWGESVGGSRRETELDQLGA